jgi:hypothetical protein
MTGIINFFDNFVKHYTGHTSFRDLLAVILMQLCAAKVETVMNPKYGSKVLDFMVKLLTKSDNKTFLMCFENSTQHHIATWMKKKNATPYPNMPKNRLP